jgi:ribose/xylose/arabinose/galactoside ABC-type transport system permease subunit
MSMTTTAELGRQARFKTIRREAGRAVSAALIALGIAFIIVLLTSEAPLEAFNVLLTAPMSRPRTIGLWIDDVAKLTVTGLAFSLVFQARQFSMGVQGQVYVGALAASYVALSPLGATWAGIPLGLAAAMLAGALWGFIPGIAKVKFGANEIVSSLMLNYIAIELCNFLVRTNLPKPQAGVLTSNNFPETAVFPALVPGTRIDIGLLFAIVAVLAVWFALYRTSWGLKLRLVGHNASFAEYSGIKATFIMVSAMTACRRARRPARLDVRAGPDLWLADRAVRGQPGFRGHPRRHRCAQPAACRADRRALLRLSQAGRAADEHAYRCSGRGDRHRHGDHHPARLRRPILSTASRGKFRRGK